MRAPQMWLVLLKWISISLPKRLLLWLRSVLALPKASRMGLVCRAAAESIASQADTR